MNLLELATKYGAGKLVPETFAYMDAYEDHFAKVRLKVKTVMEIGVQEGGSLKMWRDYFPGANIVGIDITPDCLRFKESRIDVIMGDQSDKIFLAEFAKDHRFDIIVDDGGHKMKHQLRSFNHLWPIVNPGGWYVIEDLYTSYWPKWDGKPMERDNTTIAFLKTLIDEINWRAMVHPRALQYKREWKPIGIKSLHFYPGIVFIEKE